MNRISNDNVEFIAETHASLQGIKVAFLIVKPRKAKYFKYAIMQMQELADHVL